MRTTSHTRRFPVWARFGAMLVVAIAIAVLKVVVANGGDGASGGVPAADARDVAIEGAREHDPDATIEDWTCAGDTVRIEPGTTTYCAGTMTSIGVTTRYRFAVTGTGGDGYEIRLSDMHGEIVRDEIAEQYKGLGGTVTCPEWIGLEETARCAIERNGRSRVVKVTPLAKGFYRYSLR